MLSPMIEEYWERYLRDTLEHLIMETAFSPFLPLISKEWGTVTFRVVLS